MIRCDKIDRLLEAEYGEHAVSYKKFNAFLTLLTLRNGKVMLCKESQHARIEGQMITYLSKYIRCAELYYFDDDLLLMEYIDDRSRIDEKEAARDLAQMHLREFDYFGFEYDTTIGPYLQSNTPSKSWIDFFTNQRVMQMASACYQEGKIESSLLNRIERFSDKFGNYLREPPHASLLHGDLWSGNVLSKEGKAVYIDPAVYYGHYEMELAFITLFHTFSEEFFQAYHESLPIDGDFFTTRKDILNLYPLLVHVRSFGHSYRTQVEAIVSRFGY